MEIFLRTMCFEQLYILRLLSKCSRKIREPFSSNKFTVIIKMLHRKIDSVLEANACDSVDHHNGERESFVLRLVVSSNI